MIKDINADFTVKKNGKVVKTGKIEKKYIENKYSIEHYWANFREIFDQELSDEIGILNFLRDTDTLLTEDNITEMWDANSERLLKLRPRCQDGSLNMSFKVN